MNIGLTIRKVMVFSVSLLLLTFIMPFIPGELAESLNLNIMVPQLLWPPALILLCGCLWLHLTKATGVGREGEMFQTSGILAMLSMLWIGASFLLIDDLDTLKIESVWHDGVYIVWIGTSLLAIDITVMIWGMFYVLGFTGKGPLPYFLTIMVLFFLSTPLAIWFSPDISFFLAFIYNFYGYRMMLFGIIPSCSVIGGLLWGMIYDRWMMGEAPTFPSRIKLSVTSAFALAVVPISISLLDIMTMGFSSSAALIIQLP